MRKLLLLPFFVFVQSCGDDIDDVKAEKKMQLTRHVWHYTGPIREIERVIFETNGDLLITMPSDSITGTYAVDRDTIKMQNQRRILVPQRIDGNLVDTLLNFSCNWLILKLDEDILEVEDLSGHPNFGCITTPKNLLFDSVD